MSPFKRSRMFSVAARVCRGSGIEAVHAAAIAVVGADSRLTHVLGDPELVFFSRSSIKPLQALPLVQAGGLERFGFGSQELALCCSSHNGSELHRSVAANMLERLGLSPAALQCGTDVPLELLLNRRYPTQGEDQDPLRHNCSGKHCGFLALSALMQQPRESYLEPEGAPQRAVRSAVADACEVDVESLLVGVDGCSAPNFALPLRALAVGFKNLMLAPLESGQAPMAAMARVRAAMLEQPLLVSGEKRLDYALAQAFPRRVLVKGGAEGVLLLAFDQPALGIAIKVLDGAQRALGPIVVETLKQLGLIDDIGRFPTLARHETPEIKNARRLRTGEIQADFRLEKL